MSQATLVSRNDLLVTHYMVFLLVTGNHCGLSLYEEGGEIKEDVRYFTQGMRIKTRTNLSKRLGEKFRRISDSEGFDNGYPFEVEMTAKDLEDLNKDDEQYLTSNLVAEQEREKQQRDLAQSNQTMEGAKIAGGLDTSPDAALESMTVDELVKLAHEEEIDLGPGKMTKTKLIEIINSRTRDRAGM